MNNSFLSQLAHYICDCASNDFSSTTIFREDYISRKYLSDAIIKIQISTGTSTYLPKILSLKNFINSKSVLPAAEKYNSIYILYRTFFCERNSDLSFFEFFPIGEKILETFNIVDKHSLNIKKLLPKDLLLSNTLNFDLLNEIYKFYIDSYEQHFNNLTQHSINIFLDDKFNTTALKKEIFIFILTSKLSETESKCLHFLQSQAKNFKIITNNNFLNLNKPLIGKLVDDIIIINAEKSKIAKRVYEIPCKGYMDQQNILDNLLYKVTNDFDSSISHESTEKVAIILDNPLHLPTLLSSKIFSKKNTSFNLNINIQTTHAFKLILSLISLYKKHVQHNYCLQKSDLFELYFNPILKSYFTKNFQPRMFYESNIYIDDILLNDLKKAKILDFSNASIGSVLLNSIKGIIELSKKFISEIEQSALAIILEKIEKILPLIELEDKGSIARREEKIDFCLSQISMLTFKVQKYSQNSTIDILQHYEISILDYDKVFFMEFEEKKIPKKSLNKSLLKENFYKKVESKLELETTQFFNFIENSEELYLLYNSESYEISRFAQQIKLSEQVIYDTLEYKFISSERINGEIVIQKNESILKKLQKFNYLENPDATTVSPTMLNTYIDCSLKFYFQYIENLKHSIENQQVSFKKNLGIDLHELCKNMYSKIHDHEKKVLDKNYAVHVINNLHAEVELFLQKKYLKNPKKQLNGELSIAQTLISSYIKKLLVEDLKFNNLEILSIENQNFLKNLNVLVFSVDEKYAIKLSGIIDRLDRVDNIIRVIDYKTGKGNNKILSISSLFNCNLESRPKDALQILVYAFIVSKGLKINSDLITPKIFYMKDILSTNAMESNIKIKQEKKYVEIFDVSKFSNEIEKNIVLFISNLFDKSLPFTQTSNISKCNTCQFSKICNRN